MDRFNVAVDVVQYAGDLLRQCRLEESEICQKMGHQDLVTHWDRRVERMLRSAILETFPQDSIVGEEYPPEECRAGAVTWYIDPIDGTTNFINQHQNYAISVGCWEGSLPLFGLVLDVERKTLYWARHGGGAWQNQTLIHTSGRRELSELLLTTPGLQYTFLEPHPYQERMIRLSRKVRGVRCLGSVALELCEVAAGRADLFVTMRSSPWDHNAARIILEEAGGATFTVDGDELPLGQKSTVLALNDMELKDCILCV